jgi:hypothetical protein
MFRRRFLVVGFVATLVACGGGGGGGGSAPPVAAFTAPPAATTPAATPVPTATPGTVPKGQARATFSIRIPKTGTQSAGRAPRAVPPGTKSIKFTLIKTDNPSTPAGGSVTYPVFPLTASSPGCTDNGTFLTCTLQVTAPLGTDIFIADVYGTTDGSGTKLGSGTVRMVVIENATNTASLTLAGPVAAVVLSTDDFTVVNNVVVPIAYLTTIADTQLPGSQSTIPQSARIFVVALDNAGNQIIAPDTFDTPVTLTLAPNTFDNTAGALRKQLGTRRPSTAPPPPQTIAQITVTYAFPQGAVTSAATSATVATVAVQSPADRIVVAPAGTTTDVQTFLVTATVNNAVQTTKLIFATEPNACPAGDVGAPPFGCALVVTPTPSPAPLAWTNDQTYSNFTQPPFSGDASFQAAFDPSQDFLEYQFELDTRGVTRNFIVDATTCEPYMLLVNLASQPAPSPSPSPFPSSSPSASPSAGPSATPSPSPTPNPGSYTVTGTAANPEIAFYVRPLPPAGTCVAKGRDGVGHEADLTFSFTQGNLIIQRRSHR